MFDLNLSITPGASAREWLSKQTDADGQPLAKFPARGQFSSKAKQALEQAAAGGMTFTDPVKAPKAPAAPKPPKANKPEVKQETAGEKRARLMAELDALDAEPEAVPTNPKVEVTTPEVVREQVTLYASEDGEKTDSPVGFDQCFRPGCFQTVARCQCKQGPKAPANLLTIA
jgi:hypothetical protein